MRKAKKFFGKAVSMSTVLMLLTAQAPFLNEVGFVQVVKADKTEITKLTHEANVNSWGHSDLRAYLNRGLLKDGTKIPYIDSTKSGDQGKRSDYEIAHFTENESKLILGSKVTSKVNGVEHTTTDRIILPFTDGNTVKVKGDDAGDINEAYISNGWLISDESMPTDGDATVYSYDNKNQIKVTSGIVTGTAGIAPILRLRLPDKCFASVVDPIKTGDSFDFSQSIGMHIREMKDLEQNSNLTDLSIDESSGLKLKIGVGTSLTSAKIVFSAYYPNGENKNVYTGEFGAISSNAAEFDVSAISDWKAEDGSSTIDKENLEKMRFDIWVEEDPGEEDVFYIAKGLKSFEYDSISSVFNANNEMATKNSQVFAAKNELKCAWNNSSSSAVNQKIFFGKKNETDRLQFYIAGREEIDGESSGENNCIVLYQAETTEEGKVFNQSTEKYVATDSVAPTVKTEDVTDKDGNTYVDSTWASDSVILNYEVKDVDHKGVPTKMELKNLKISIDNGITWIDGDDENKLKEEEIEISPISDFDENDNQKFTVKVSKPGEHKVELKVEDNNGNTIKLEQKNVKVFSLPEVKGLNQGNTYVDNIVEGKGTVSGTYSTNIGNFGDPRCSVTLNGQALSTNDFNFTASNGVWTCILNNCVDGNSYQIVLSQADTSGQKKELEFGVVVDTNNPTGQIIVAEKNIFENLLNTITFGLFFKDQVAVDIKGESASGIKSIEYIIHEGENVLTLENLNKMSWEVFDKDKGLNINGRNFKGVAYARITNKAGKFTIIGTNGIVVYNDTQIIDKELCFVKKEKKDLSFRVNLNGNKIGKISIGEKVLSLKEDYTVSEDGDTATVTIPSEFIDKFPASKGEDQDKSAYQIKVNINPLGMDTSALENPIENYSLNLHILKANQRELKFNDYNRCYALGEKGVKIEATGGSTDKPIIYSIISEDDDVADINENTGEITIKKLGEFSVLAYKAGDDDYNDQFISSELIVVHSEDEEECDYKHSGVNKGNGNNNLGFTKTSDKDINKINLIVLSIVLTLGIAGGIYVFNRKNKKSKN